MRVLLFLPLLLTSCHPLRDPEQACSSFLTAVRQRDAAAVFDALAQTTQWSIYSVAKVQGQMRQLIESSYPPHERSAALSRLPTTHGDGKDLFRASYPQRYEPGFLARLGSGPVRLERQAETLICGRTSGQPFRFAHSKEGNWGLVELDDEWELAKLRAVHDLDTVRENARLYIQDRQDRQDRQEPKERR